MSKPGTKPKPLALKVLDGVENKDRLNENEPKPGDPSLECPSWLTEEAIKLWNRYALVFKNLNIFKQTDEMSFATWCQEMGRYIELQGIITKEGYTTTNIRNGDKALPEMAMARECLKNARALAIEFGMTPSSRSRISVGDAEDDELDPIEEILRRKRNS